MLEGLVQHDFSLSLQYVLRRMRTVNGRSEVATLTDEGLERATFREVAERADRLAKALQSLGVRPDDRVGTFMWNTRRHLEAYFAIPCMGAVLHTLNLRLFPAQLIYIVNQAKDKVIIVDDSLVSTLEKAVPEFETVEHYIVVGHGDAGSLDPVSRYDELLDEQDASFEYPDLDDRQAAGLCYTTGTTGNPKGVLYSHRSNVLHATAAALGDTLKVGRSDRILPVVPMFHVNAWGLPYAAAMTGADLVMPNRFLKAESIARLIEDEKVTIAGAVPTIWTDLLKYADEHKPDFSSMSHVLCGGAAVSRNLMESFEERHGMRIIQAWGMTETSPLGAVAIPPAEAEGEEHWDYRTKTGRLAPLVELRIVDDEGLELPWDGESTGEVEVRGPWIASGYFEDPDASEEKFHEGWLKTGDIAAVDEDGYIKITDRSKDVIKSGGEWISSAELENEIATNDEVEEAAVIAMPDERYDERPLACIVVKEGASPGVEDLREYLGDRVAKWWVPDAFAFLDEVPKTSVGKYDKKALRDWLSKDELRVERAGEKAAAGS